MSTSIILWFGFLRFVCVFFLHPAHHRFNHTQKAVWKPNNHQRIFIISCWTMVWPVATGPVRYLRWEEDNVPISSPLVRNWHFYCVNLSPNLYAATKCNYIFYLFRYFSYNGVHDVEFYAKILYIINSLEANTSEYTSIYYSLICKLAKIIKCLYYSN